MTADYRNSVCLSRLKWLTVAGRCLNPNNPGNNSEINLLSLAIKATAGYLCVILVHRAGQAGERTASLLRYGRDASIVIGGDERLNQPLPAPLTHTLHHTRGTDKTPQHKTPQYRTPMQQNPMLSSLAILHC